MKPVSKNIIRDVRLGAADQALISSVDDIIEDVRKGRPVIIVDDEARENEGDVVIAAEMASAQNINFMAKEARGLICLPMERLMIERLGLELMGRGDNKNHRTAFTVSIEAKEGVTTGISAADRAHTIQTAINPKSGPQDIATPGHVFPLRAQDGGVLVRAGHTEASVDLAKLAGFSGAAVICEVMNDDGTMARLPDLAAYGQKHNLKIGTIAGLIAHRRQRECLVEKILESHFESTHGGTFKLHLYRDKITAAEHVVLVKGDIKNAKEPVFVRMHAVDFFSDILGGTKDSTLHTSMQIIGEARQGVIVILRDQQADTLSRRLMQNTPPEKMLKDYGIGAQILTDLGIRTMTLLTDTPKNIVGLDGYDLHIAGYRSLKSDRRP